MMISNKHIIGLVGKPKSIGTLNGRSRRLSPLSVPMDEGAPSNTFISNLSSSTLKMHTYLSKQCFNAIKFQI